MVDTPAVRLGCGDSVNYTGDADIVFSHVYGPLPAQLIGKPAIINVFGNKKAKAEEWCRAELHEVSKWGKGLTNTVYTANIAPFRVDLTNLVEVEFAPGRGWFPEDLVRALLLPATHEGEIVFDGFMGRGTVGKVASEMGFRFVGIDRDPERITIAREYLGC